MLLNFFPEEDEKMRGWKNTGKWCCLAVLLVAVNGLSIATAAEESDSWDEAGQKVKEATHAVGKATGETTDKAVAEAMKAWEEAKQKYHASVAAAKKKYDAEVEKARARIHAATAPDSPDGASGENSGQQPSAVETGSETPVAEPRD
jgi:hypothetical protein